MYIILETSARIILRSDWTFPNALRSSQSLIFNAVQFFCFFSKSHQYTCHNSRRKINALWKIEYTLVTAKCDSSTNDFGRLRGTPRYNLVLQMRDEYEIPEVALSRLINFSRTFYASSQCRIKYRKRINCHIASCVLYTRKA